jgi:phosphotransferase system enzyme I (PtsI)
MAGEVQLTRLFLGLGLREFSMHPSHLLGVKQRVLQTNVKVSAPLVERIRRADDPERLAVLLAKLNA